MVCHDFSTECAEWTAESETTIKFSFGEAFGTRFFRESTRLFTERNRSAKLYKFWPTLVCKTFMLDRNRAYLPRPEQSASVTLYGPVVTVVSFVVTVVAYLDISKLAQAFESLETEADS